MSADEARKIRAAIAEALEPLYAARIGNLAALDGVVRALERLHKLDSMLLAIERHGGEVG